MKAEGGYRLVEEGIRRLGRMELYGALQALEALDCAEDGLVYLMVPRYRDAPRAEYRIYCAWLLRRRYGVEPARTLMGLLLDSDTRVHRFTFQLLAKRGVEPELLQELLARLEAHDSLPPWHLRHVVRLLGQPKQFRGDASGTFPKVVAALRHLADHHRALIRLESYRGLVNFPEQADSTWLAPHRRRSRPARAGPWYWCRGPRPTRQLSRKDGTADHISSKSAGDMPVDGLTVS